MFAGKGMFWVTQDAADYERQQLNILRRHQGLEPIPPVYYEPKDGSDVALVWLIIVPFWFMVGGLAPTLLFEPEQLDTMGLWPWVISYSVIIVGAIKRAIHNEQESERRKAAFFRRWEQAGRP